MSDECLQCARTHLFSQLFTRTWYKKSPSVHLVLDIADYFDITTDQLLRDELEREQREHE